MEVWHTYSNTKFIITEDYNLLNITWQANDCLQFCHTPGYPFRSQADVICDYFNLLNFKQCNTVLNTSGYALDLVSSSFRNLTVYASQEVLLPCDSHHPPIPFSLPLAADCSFRSASFLRKHFAHPDCSAIKNYVGNIE